MIIYIKQEIKVFSRVDYISYLSYNGTHWYKINIDKSFGYLVTVVQI